MTLLWILVGLLVVIYVITRKDIGKHFKFVTRSIHDRQLEMIEMLKVKNMRMQIELLKLKMGIIIDIDDLTVTISTEIKVVDVYNLLLELFNTEEFMDYSLPVRLVRRDGFVVLKVQAPWRMRRAGMQSFEGSFVDAYMD